MERRLSPVLGRGKKKAPVSRRADAALGAEESGAAAGEAHEVSRLGGETRRAGSTTGTRTSVAQPQCGQTGWVGAIGGVGLSSGQGWPAGDCAWSSARACCSRSCRPRLASKP